MSVLIKGMEMPGSCIQCKLWYLIPLADTYEDICRVTGHRVNPYHRADDCPLIEVPEPHGDLIDRDALPTPRVEWEDIVNANAVIPASEKEE